MKLSKNIIEFVAYSLILLFVYTAISKWWDFELYTKQMDAQPFNNKFTPLLTIGLPIIELITSLLLFIPRLRIIGLYASLMLMVSFTIYIWLVVHNHFGYIPCPCGGVIKKLNWWQHLTFNLYFVIITIIAIMAYHVQRFTFQKTQTIPT